MGFTTGLALEADLLLHPDSFLVIYLTEFKCVSSALIVYCPTATDCTRWREKIQRAQVCEHRQGVGRQGPWSSDTGSTEGRRRERLEWLQVQTAFRRETQPDLPKSREDRLEPAAVPVTGNTQDRVP